MITRWTFTIDKVEIDCENFLNINLDFFKFLENLLFFYNEKPYTAEDVYSFLKFLNWNPSPEIGVRKMLLVVVGAEANL